MVTRIQVSYPPADPTPSRRANDSSSVPVISVDLSPAGNMLATGSGDREARICASHLLRNPRISVVDFGRFREIHCYLLIAVTSACNLSCFIPPSIFLFWFLYVFSLFPSLIGVTMSETRFGVISDWVVNGTTNLWGAPGCKSVGAGKVYDPSSAVRTHSASFVWSARFKSIGGGDIVSLSLEEERVVFFGRSWKRCCSVSLRVTRASRTAPGGNSE